MSATAERNGRRFLGRMAALGLILALSNPAEAAFPSFVGRECGHPPVADQDPAGPGIDGGDHPDDSEIPSVVPLSGLRPDFDFCRRRAESTAVARLRPRLRPPTR